MKTKLFTIAIIFLILGVLISQLKVIPSFTTIQNVLLVSVFLVALITALLFLFKLWIRKHKEKKTSRTQRVVRTFIMITASPLAWLLAIPGLNEPELVNELSLANQTIYIYHKSCFPPDNACECDYYGSSIYTKNQYLPVMHLVLETDFYVGSVQLNNGELIVKASDSCSKDLGKTKKTNL